MCTKKLFMPADFKILIINDDGYNAKGLRELVEIMRPYGTLTIVSPKTHQSGMSVAVSIGDRVIAYKKIKEEEGATWHYLDASPASCVKFALDQIYPDRKCDLVVCGINHGSNAAVAANYSGTMGAAEEAAINGIPSIGVSLCEYGDDINFSKVKRYFPSIFERLMNNMPERKGISYNINFPPSDVPVAGVKVCHSGYGYWIEEFEPWMVPGRSTEEGERLFVMRGRFVDGHPAEDRLADHHAIEDGFISITPQTFDRTDHKEAERLSRIMDVEF